MTERLALPAVDSAPSGLDDWTGGLSRLGHPAAVARQDASSWWIEVATLRLRGFAVTDGDHLEAILFEMHAPDPSPALDLIEAAASALGWEIHDDPDDDDLD